MRRNQAALYDRVWEACRVMNPEMRICLPPILLIAALVLASCTREQKTALPVEKAAPPPTDTVSPASGSQTVLEKTFIVKSAATFPFEIPAHAVRPHLHGIFASFVRGQHVDSNDAANVNFLILNADQYADFVGNRPSEALFSVEASRNQSVNLDLPPSFDQPKKYYLIFRNTGSAPPKSVEANFHVDF
jgi:hypothetical protein